VGPEQLLARLTTGNLRNVRFRDFCSLAEAFGFRLERVRGSHHIYRHVAISARLNLQDHRGEAKPYQIRQLLTIVEECNLTLEKRR
jgi:predicted RNA binding protein YcfA (HicA-like mRNA interferase family)